MRVFYFANATTPEDLQDLATQVREGLEKLAMQTGPTAAVELGICGISRAMVLRGTPVQIASAARVITETTSGAR